MPSLLFSQTRLATQSMIRDARQQARQMIVRAIKNNESAVVELLDSAKDQEYSGDFGMILDIMFATFVFRNIPRSKLIVIPIGSLVGLCSGGPYLGSRIRHTALLLDHRGWTLHAFSNGHPSLVPPKYFEHVKVYGFLYPKNPLFVLVLEKIRENLLENKDCFHYIKTVFSAQAGTLIHPFKKCIYQSGRGLGRSTTAFTQMMRFREILRTGQCEKKLYIVCSSFLFYLYLVILYEVMIFTETGNILTITDHEASSIRAFNEKYNWDVKRCWPLHIRDIAAMYPDEFGFLIVDEDMIPITQ